MSSPLYSKGNVTRALSCAGVAALAGVLYINALHNPFIYDDFRTVVENGSIVSVRDVSAIVFHEITRPLTNLSFTVDRALWGVEPFGFHLTNLVLHVLNTILVFALASGIGDDMRADATRRIPDASTRRLPAIVVAGLFAAHPVMTEAVGYVSGRADLLCTALFLAAFVAARARLAGAGLVSLVAVWLFWAAAMMAKETAAVFPFVLLAFTFVVGPIRRVPTNEGIVDSGWAHRLRVLQLTAPLVVVMAAAVVIRALVFARFEQGASALRLPSVTSAVVAFWHYARLVAIPAGQTIFHSAVSEERTSLVSWISVVVAPLALATAWRVRHGLPGVFLGGSWFTLTLAPALVLSGGGQGGTVAEHRLYLPAVGAFLVVGALIGEARVHLAKFRSARLLAPLALGSTVLMLGGRTVIRNLVWADPVSIWREATEYAPADPIPFSVLGESLHSVGRHTEAIEAYSTALALQPDGESALLNMVVCLSETARAAEASAAIDAFGERHPSSLAVPLGRGSIDAIEGRSADARAQFLLALTIDPQSVMARQWLAVLAEESGDTAEALHRCYELQRLAPGRASTEGCIERLRLAR